MIFIKKPYPNRIEKTPTVNLWKRNNLQSVNLINLKFKIIHLLNHNRAITDFKLNAIASMLYFSTHLSLAFEPRSFADSKS